jgi:predicted nuclease of predicted toxin-antitoxin system
VRFIVDAQLPPLLARFLSDQGHPSEHVSDIGLGTARDREIWDRAIQSDAALVTKDEDFITMRALNSTGPAIVWVRLGNTTRTELVRHFSAVLPAIIAGLQKGETVIEVSRDG